MSQHCGASSASCQVTDAELLKVVRQWIADEGRNSPDTEGFKDLSMTRFGILLKQHGHGKEGEKATSVARRLAQQSEIQVVPVGKSQFLRLGSDPGRLL